VIYFSSNNLYDARHIKMEEPPRTEKRTSERTISWKSLEIRVIEIAEIAISEKQIHDKDLVREYYAFLDSPVSSPLAKELASPELSRFYVTPLISPRGERLAIPRTTSKFDFSRMGSLLCSINLSDFFAIALALVKEDILDILLRHYSPRGYVIKFRIRKFFRPFIRGEYSAFVDIFRD